MRCCAHKLCLPPLTLCVTGSLRDLAHFPPCLSLHSYVECRDRRGFLTLPRKAYACMPREQCPHVCHVQSPHVCHAPSKAGPPKGAEGLAAALHAHIRCCKWRTSQTHAQCSVHMLRGSSTRWEHTLVPRAPSARSQLGSQTGCRPEAASPSRDDMGSRGLHTLCSANRPFREGAQ